MKIAVNRLGSSHKFHVSETGKLQVGNLQDDGAIGHDNEPIDLIGHLRWKLSSRVPSAFSRQRLTKIRQ